MIFPTRMFCQTSILFPRNTAAYPLQQFHAILCKGDTMEKPKLLDVVRSRIRLKHMSRKTEEAYVYWIKRFILYFDKRHPREMGEHEVEKFLTHLAVEENVAASTQNLALNAIIFLYKQVLERDLAPIH